MPFFIMGSEIPRFAARASHSSARVEGPSSRRNLALRTGLREYFSMSERYLIRLHMIFWYCIISDNNHDHPENVLASLGVLWVIVDTTTRSLKL
ncbi:hypothetical protein BV22DRAFT_44928 [Leucogyrophana mollusca]|uniref:Uncharacterized protein n=1 Tax=Leucogyrophana mollusca TaxID=85980 RepID=A0ACB8BXF6_9AGAM|nr:hypothetical protein BV22DRAFT_44928 [Leucogyrophana mollusca]